jgi:hypothetical protein
MILEQKLFTSDVNEFKVVFIADNWFTFVDSKKSEA